MSANGEALPPGAQGFPVNGRTRLPGPEPIPADLLRDSALRAAFDQRDIGTVYVKLGHRGVSQRRIAALTGQSQSEIGEIIAGRQVTSVALLERIADGLGVPRTWLGLAAAGQPDVSPVPQPRRGRPPRSAPPARPTPALVELAEDSPLVQLAVRAYLAGLLMSDALDPFRDR
jgi:transcriptional regulator with XRE-family HTH domain